MSKGFYFHHPHSGDAAFASDWKAAGSWAKQEQLQVWVGKQDGYVHVQVIVQNLAARFFASLLNAITFGRVKGLGQLGKKVIDYYAIKVHINDKQQDLIRRIISKKEHSLSAMQKELFSSLYSLLPKRVKHLPTQPKAIPIPPKPVEIPPVQPDVAPDDFFEGVDFLLPHKPTEAAPTLTHEFPPYETPKETLSEKVNTVATVIHEQPPVHEPEVQRHDSVFDEGVHPQIVSQPSAEPSRLEIVEWVEKMKLEFASFTQKEPEQLTWMGKLFDRGHAFVVSKLPKIKEWEDQLISYFSQPLPIPEEDNRDLEFMDQWEAKMHAALVQLQSLAAYVEEDDPLSDELQQIKEKLEGYVSKFKDLRSYHERCEALDKAIEVSIDQMEAISGGYYNLNADNYAAIVDLIASFQQFSEMVEGDVWKQKLQRKCTYQIEQAQRHLEDFADHLFENVEAEFFESKSHSALALKNGLACKPSKLFDHLQHVYDAKLCLSTLHRDMQRLEQRLNVIGENNLLPQITRNQIQKDRERLAQLLKNKTQAQENSSKFIIHMFKHVKNADLEKHFQEIQKAFQASPPNEAAVIKAERQLEALDFLGKRSALVRKSHPEIANFAKELGKKATAYKAEKRLVLDDIQLGKSIRNQRAILTDQKKRVINEKIRLERESPYSPTQLKVLSYFLTYLQVWDRFLSPLAGKIILPVGRKDFNFYMRMMESKGRLIKSDPANAMQHAADYQEYYQQAINLQTTIPDLLGIGRSDMLDFLAMYDRYCRGEIRLNFGPSYQPFEVGPFPEGSNRDGADSMPETEAVQEEHMLANASEWEKWVHSRIYPRLRDAYFDGLIETYKHVEISEPPAESPANDSLNYYLYRMFKCIQDQKGPDEINLYVEKAAALQHGRGFVNEYNRYLQSRREAFVLPPNEVPLTTTPLAQEVLKEMRRDAVSLVNEVDSQEPSTTSIEVVDSWKQLKEAAKEAYDTAQELSDTAPPTYADKWTKKGWLHRVEAFRHQYQEKSEHVRAAIFVEKWKDEIGIEKLKAYVQSPKVDMNDSTFGSLFGNEPSESLKALQIALFQKRLDLFKNNPLCTEGTINEFCRDYLGNAAFARQVTEEPTLLQLKQSERFDFESQLKALSDYHHQYQHTYVSHQRRQLMLEALRSFSGRLQAWQEKDLLNVGEMEYATGVVSQIENAIEKGKELSLQQSKADRTLDLSQLSFENRVVNIPRDLPFNVVNSDSIITDQIAPPTPSSQKSIYIEAATQVPSGDRLSATIETILNELQSKIGELESCPQAKYVIQDFIMKIPLNDPLFWNQVASTKAEETRALVSKLRDLSAYFLVVSKNEITPESLFIQLKMYALAYKAYLINPSIPFFPFTSNFDFKNIYDSIIEHEKVFRFQNPALAFAITELLSFYLDSSVYKKYEDAEDWLGRYGPHVKEIRDAIHVGWERMKERSSEKGHNIDFTTLSESDRTFYDGSWAIGRQYLLSRLASSEFPISPLINEMFKESLALAKLEPDIYGLLDFHQLIALIDSEFVIQDLRSGRPPFLKNDIQSLNKRLFGSIRLDLEDTNDTVEYLFANSWRRDGTYSRPSFLGTDNVKSSWDPFHTLNVKWDFANSFIDADCNIIRNQKDFSIQALFASAKWEVPESVTREMYDTFGHLQGQAQRSHSFFTKHIDLLDKPKFQQFLQLSLLYPKALEADFNRSIQENHKFADDLALLCQQAFTHYIINDLDVNTAMFVIEVNDYLNKFISKLATDKNRFESNFQLKFIDSRKKLKELLNDPKCSIDQRKLLLTSYMKSYAVDPVSTREEAVEFITANIELELITPDLLNDPFYAIKDYSGYSKAQKITNCRDQNYAYLAKELSQSRDAILNAVFQRLHHGASPIVWKQPYKDKLYFKSHDDRIEIDLDKFRITENGGLSSSMPEHIKKDPKLIRVLGNNEIKVVSKVQINQPKDCSAYQFIGPGGNDYRVLVYGHGDIVIQINVNRQWHQWVDGQPYAIDLPKAFLESYHCWHSPKPLSLILTDKNTGVIVFRTTTSVDLNKPLLIKSDDHANNVALAELGSSKVLRKTIKKFEDSSSIIVLQDVKNKKISHLMFPRYGLGFTVKQHERELRAECNDKFPGYYLAKDQHVAAAGRHEHYLVLEKLLPSGKYSRLVLFPKISLTTEGQPDYDRTEGIIFSYELVNDEFISASSSGEFYLALLNLHDNDYTSAYRHLTKQISQREAYDKSSVDILKWIATTEIADSNPQALAIKLKAISMLLKNSSDFAPAALFPIPELEQEALLYSYVKYLKAGEDVVLVPLSRDDERLLINHCRLEIHALVNKDRMKIVQRMQELHMPLAGQLTSLSYVADDKTKEEGRRFSSIRLGTIYPNKGALQFSSEFYDQYDFVVNIQTKSKDEINEFISSINGSKHWVMFWSKDSMVKKLKNVLANLQQSTDDKKFLHYLVLEAAVTQPNKFPKNLKLGLSQNSHPREYFNEHLFEPMRQWVLSTSDVAARFVDLPKIQAIPVESTKSRLAVSYAYFPPIKPLQMPVHWKEYLVEIPAGEKAQGIHQATLSNLHEMCSVSLKDNIAQRNLDNLQKKIYEAFKVPLPSTFETRSLEKLQQTHHANIAEASKMSNELKTLQSKIELVANRKHTLIERITQQTRIFAKREKRIELHDTIQSFLRGEGISSHVDDLVKTYLLKATHLQRINYISLLQKNILTAISDQVNPFEIQKMLDELGQEEQRLETICYDVKIHPEYLVLEFYEGIKFRPEQIKILDLLKIKKGVIGAPEHLGKVVELRPAAGKTSVVMPLLGWMHADGKKLAISMMPQPLIESVSKTLQEKMGKSFHQILEEMTFNSKSSMDLISLRRELSRLHSVKHDRKVLLISSESVHYLYLNFSKKVKDYLILKSAGSELDSNLEREIETLIEIFSLLKESGVALLDEIDLLLNILKSSHLATGFAKWLDFTFTMSTNSLYRYLQDRPEMWNAIKQSKETYRTQFKQQMIEDIVAGKLHSGNEDFHAYLTSLSVSDKEKGTRKLELIREYLNGNDDRSITSFVEAISNEAIQDILAVFREQLNELLPLTFTKNLYQHFGPPAKRESLSDFLAIPYHDGKPTSEGTCFGTELETCNYTLQMFLEQGVTVEFLTMVVKDIKEKINESLAKKKIATASDHALFQFFIKLADNKKYNPLALSTIQLNEIKDIINSNPQKIIDIVQKFVLPKIKVYPNQLNANSQLFGVILKQLLGMSGTVWNAETYHRSITDVQPSSTDVNTLALLLKPTNDGMPPPPVKPIELPKNFNEQEIKKLLIKAIDGHKPCSIIDVANLFRGIPTITVAKQLLTIAMEQNWGIKGVGYYDSNDKLMVLTYSNGTWISLELANSGIGKDELVMVWDQPHTTGSDVKLSSTMHAAVTVGRHSIFRDVVQGVWRQRNRDKLQTDHFVIATEDLEYVNSMLEETADKVPTGELHLKDFLLFSILQQSLRQGNENYRSLKQKMQSVVLEKTMAAMAKAKTAEHIAEIYSLCRPLFESDQETRAFHLYGRRPLKKAMPTKAAITSQERESIRQAKQKRITDEVVGFLQSSVVTVFKTHPLLSQSGSWDEIDLEIRALGRSEINKLPDFLPPMSDYGKERNIQTLQQQEVDVNVEVETNVATRVVEAGYEMGPLKKEESVSVDWLPYIITTRADLDRCHIAKLGQIFGSHYLASAFSSQLLVSPLMFKYNDRSGKRVWVGLPQLYEYALRKEIRDYSNLNLDNIGRHDFYKILVIQDRKTKELQTVLLTMADEPKLTELLRRNKEIIDYKGNPPEIILGMYDLRTGMVEQGSNEYRINAVELEESPQLQLLKIQAKFFQGEIDYTSKELNMMESWLKTLEEPQVLIDFFKNTILGWRRITPKEYLDSSLAPLFTKLKDFIPPPPQKPSTSSWF